MKIIHNIFEFYKELSYKIGISSKILSIILGSFFAIMLMPLIFSIKGCESLAFNESTGVIGDTIGGITAPFISFLGAILVYLALKEQIKANHLIQKQFNSQEISKNEELIFEKSYNILNILIDSLNNFSFKSPYKVKEDKGSTAISLFLELVYSKDENRKGYRKIDSIKIKEVEFLTLLGDINQLLSFFLDHSNMNKSYLKIFYFRYTKIPILISPDFIYNSEIEETFVISNEIYEIHNNFKKLYTLVELEKGVKMLNFEYLDKLKKILNS